MTAIPTYPAVVIGGGPAGLMAAEALACVGVEVHLFDAMPSPGRKLLRAGKGGLNLSHAEPWEDFLNRYGESRPWVTPWLERFGPEAVRHWAAGLGIETFIGSSGRIFPSEMKAAPLLRAWIRRMRDLGVHFHMRHRWLGWDGSGVIHFQAPEGMQRIRAQATVLALGGGSWAATGSDGAWVELLRGAQIGVAELRPANCGFQVDWSAHIQDRFAGAPLKGIVAFCRDLQGVEHRQAGDAVISAQGIEGGAIYAISAWLRDVWEVEGAATLMLDLTPGRSVKQLQEALERPRGKDSWSNWLRKRTGLTGIKAALLKETLLREGVSGAERDDPAGLAARIKSLPVFLTAPNPIDEAISTAGGVMSDALDEALMAQGRPGLFVAGEMLDWEAPTGGYLLTACLASGLVAGEGAAAWLREENKG